MRKPIALLIVVWASALSAAALAYAVHRPIVPPRSFGVARASTLHRRVSARVDRVIEVPEQVIVCPAAPRPSRVDVSP
jgi:hypothetical protein